MVNNKMRNMISVLIASVLVLLLAGISVSADDIPTEMMEQKAGDSYQFLEKGTVYGILVGPDMTAKIVEWRMTGEDEAKEIADSFITNSQEVIGFGIGDILFKEVVFTSDQAFDYLNPSASVRYEQVFNGIAVLDSSIRINVNAYGVVTGRNDMGFVSGLDVSTDPEMTRDEAEEIAKQKYGVEELELEQTPRLYVHYTNKLVYRMNILGPVGKEVLIDANTGEIISEKASFVTGESPSADDIASPEEETSEGADDAEETSNKTSEETSSGTVEKPGSPKPVVTGSQANETESAKAAAKKGKGINWMAVLIPLVALIILIAAYLFVRSRNQPA